MIQISFVLFEMTLDTLQKLKKVHVTQLDTYGESEVVLI